MNIRKTPGAISRWPALASLASLTAIAAAPAIAAEWEFNPRLEAGVLYDDNYRLATPGGEIDVNGPIADLEMEMRTLTETGEFSLAPRVRATYFPDADELDAVDYFTTLYWERRGQRANMRLRGEVAQQDIVSSELPDVDSGGDLGEPDIGDGGRLLVDNRRLRAEVRPTWNFDVSERREIQLDLGYTHVAFDDQIDAAQVDFNTADVAAGLITRLSPTKSFTARLRAARYDIETREEHMGYGAEVQWDWTTSAERRTYLRFGAQQVEFDTVDPFGVVTDDSQVAWLAGAGTNWVAGRNELFLDLTRNVGASSAGVLIARDQLRLRWTRAMTPRLSLVAGLRGTHDDSLDDSPTTTFTERSYATGDVGLQWRWQEEFSLRVAYDYTWQEFRDATEDATSSGAMVTILYQPLQRRR